MNLKPEKNIYSNCWDQSLSRRIDRLFIRYDEKRDFFHPLFQMNIAARNCSTTHTSRLLPPLHLLQQSDIGSVYEFDLVLLEWWEKVEYIYRSYLPIHSFLITVNRWRPKPALIATRLPTWMDVHMDRKVLMTWQGYQHCAYPKSGRECVRYSSIHSQMNLK